MENVYDDLKVWIDEITSSISKYKAIVLLNGYVDGYVSSTIAAKILGRENVMNVSIPCYSTPEYMLETVSFSNDMWAESKIIGLKHVYDSIMGIEDNENNEVDEHIIDHIRKSIVETIAYKSDSILFEFNDEKFRIRWSTSDLNLAESTFERFFTKEDMLELADFLKLEEKYIL